MIYIRIPKDRFLASLPKQWYVSPTGSPTASGKINDPLDIDTIIGSTSPIKPGDIVNLRGGTYSSLVASPWLVGSGAGTAGIPGKGTYDFRVKGRKGSNITFRSYPGEWAVINAGIHIVSGGNGEYITLRDMELKSTPTTRVFTDAQMDDFPLIYVTGPGCKFINCYIHDYQDLHWYPYPACDGEDFHGCLIGAMGYWDVELNRGRGYCIYAHNLGGGKFKLHKNAWMGGFNGNNLGAQSGAASNIRDFDIQHNIMLHGSLLFGSSSGDAEQNNRFAYNYVYLSEGYVTDMPQYWSRHGYENTQGDGEGMEFDHNYMMVSCGDANNSNVIQYVRLRESHYHHNTIINNRNGVLASRSATYYESIGVIKSVIIDYNDYYNNYISASLFWYDPMAAYMNFADWQANSGFDANSSFTAALPPLNKIVVINNDYSRGRGFIAIYNHESAASEVVDLSALNIPDGANCRLRYCANWDEYVDFTFDASAPTLTIDLSPGVWNQRIPTAYDCSLGWFSDAFPTFGAWQVEVLSL